MRLHIFTRAMLVCTTVLVICPIHSNPTALAQEGGEAETGGNCLSYPVIWPENEGESRPSFPSPSNPLGDWGPNEDDYVGEKYTTLEGDFTKLVDGFTTMGDTDWYYQHDPNNVWQADWAEKSGDELPVYVDLIDWGDNLEARTWTTSAPVRVEVVLYSPTSSEESYQGYEMHYIAYEMTPDEMWGTNKNTYILPSDPGPTVYSDLAHLTIQKIDDPAALTWDSTQSCWTPAPDGSVSVNGGLVAEVNVKGKVIYGYNWNASEEATYRITFSFDNETNVSFAHVTSLPEVNPMSARAFRKGPPAEKPPAGGTAYVNKSLNITYIDVTIGPARGGGGGGNGPGGNGPGGNGPGGNKK